MTFIIALQTADSLVLSADNTMLAFRNGEIAPFETMNANKIHSWNNGFFTGTGEYYVIDRIRKYLVTSDDIPSLPSLLNHEKRLRTQEIGENEQIANTRLILSSITSNGPRIYIVDNQSAQEIQPGELLMFFPLDYDFLTVSEQEIHALNSNMRDYSTFEDNHAWCDFYTAHFSTIYAIQHQNNPQISASFHITFQTANQKHINFIPSSVQFDSL